MGRRSARFPWSRAILRLLWFGVSRGVAEEEVGGVKVGQHGKCLAFFIVLEYEMN